MASRNKISKFWLVVHTVLAICTGGLWLIPIGIWWVMQNSKK
ncbi:hypothetical protein GORDON_46 [Arthrobacter phage Gordon]|uniref:Uncharacterized protein n=1 Tax=Arthrobacter phage Gordon TaxID=1772298 RepID=A0A0U4B2R7_9CAUD|nr:hypothetical protein FDH69_gp46 [Arthrobacter phage Gordon]ALY09021.1 hypothetical protein GORDON_46 [Arthrobacter phage Gordon]